MHDTDCHFEKLIRYLLDPATTRQLAKQFEQIRQTIFDQLREAGCPDDVRHEVETVCLHQQRHLELILAAHAERLEAWQEYHPEAFDYLRCQFVA